MNIVIQRVCEDAIPDDEHLRQWVSVALPKNDVRELVLRLVDEAESQTLNREWREIDKPTNVLSFPAEPLPVDVPELLAQAALGDLVLCAPVVAREASEQGKSLEAHWAHMLIHGCLHLQGFDHVKEAEAEQMEARERELLAELNFPDPYK